MPMNNPAIAGNFFLFIILTILSILTGEVSGSLRSVLD